MLQTILYILVILYLLSCICLWALQDRILYHPTPATDEPRYSHFTLASQDKTAQLKIWHIPSQSSVVDEVKSTILFFGGNADAVEAFLDPFATHFANVPPHSDVYIMNYRAYGGSTGRPSEKGLNADARTLYDHVASRYDEVYVIGRSLGTGIAVDLAAKRVVDKLVLITAYDSILKVARDRFSVFPVRWLLRDHYASIDKINATDAPVLMLTASNDQTIPRSHSDALKAHIAPASRVEEIILDGTEHNNISYHPGFYPAIQRFLLPTP